MPERIQLSRKKGWRMPANTVKVDRTTKWGNPFVIGEPIFRDAWRCVQDRRHAWQLYRSMALINDKLIAMAREELRGKHLACWCPRPTDPYGQDECHAAVLLEIANSQNPTRLPAADQSPGT